MNELSASFVFPITLPASAFDTENLWTLPQLLKKLVGVKPLVAIRELEMSHSAAVIAEANTFDIGTVTLPLAVSDEWFRRNYAGSKCVTPYGAALLADLYKAGNLPMSRAIPQPIPEDVRAYMDSSDELVAKYAARQAAHAERAVKEAAWVAQPETIPESEFTYGLLNAVFFAYGMVGPSGMTIGGLSVWKEPLRFVSNSGKSADYEVSFKWVSASGEAKILTKSSVYARNRRSDSGRNNGLPG